MLGYLSAPPFGPLIGPTNLLPRREGATLGEGANNITSPNQQSNLYGLIRNSTCSRDCNIRFCVTRSKLDSSSPWCSFYGFVSAQKLPWSIPSGLTDKDKLSDTRETALAGTQIINDTEHIMITWIIIFIICSLLMTGARRAGIPL